MADAGRSRIHWLVLTRSPRIEFLPCRQTEIAMGHVFVSWGSPDEQQFLAVSEALRENGLDVWDSRHDMGAGDVPYGEVLDAIRGADVAVFLLSGRVANRDWVRRELDWCYQEYRDRPQLQILPFLVGNPLEATPALIADLLLHIDDVSAMDDEALNRLVTKVRERLGLATALDIPVALFAMTSAQFAALAPESLTLVNAMYGGAGISLPTAAELARRYGDTPEAFRPFGEVPLKELVDRLVFVANAARAAPDPPLRLVWCRERLVGGQDRALEILWGQRHVVFLDSVSLAHEPIADQLRNLPWPDSLDKSAVIFVPPYSRPTDHLQPNVQDLVRNVAWLRRAYADFVSAPDAKRPLGFELTFSATFCDWLVRILAQRFAEEPVRDKLSTMRRRFPPPPLTPRRDFHRRTPLGGD